MSLSFCRKKLLLSSSTHGDGLLYHSCTHCLCSRTCCSQIACHKHTSYYREHLATHHPVPVTLNITPQIEKMSICWSKVWMSRHRHEYNEQENKSLTEKVLVFSISDWWSSRLMSSSSKETGCRMKSSLLQATTSESTHGLVPTA